MKDSTFKKYCLVIDQLCVNGFNQRKAYQEFYPNASNETADVEMVRILNIPKVSEYLASKQKNTSEKLQITLERQIKELEELKELSKDDAKYNDAINALKEQNKLLALYVEHNKQKTIPNRVIVNMSDYNQEKK